MTPKTSEPMQILLNHNHWATCVVLDSCRGLSDEQFHQTFEIGLGSLHNILRHVVGAMRGWNDVLAQRDSRPRLEEGDPMRIDEIGGALDEAAQELKTLANAGSPADILTRERGGREYSFTRGGIVTHVTTHGMHHRAQCINILRRLGAADPNPSVLNWALTVDSA